MASNERREHERIDILMHTRMWLDEEYRGKMVLFEGYAETRNLAIGGVYLASNYLLPAGFPINLEISIGDGEYLLTRAEVAHRNESSGESGMGITFTDVDAENRERLLRFFISDRIRDFYKDRFIVEFPHLETVLSLKDAALVINLWEDKEHRLTRLGKPTTKKTARR